MPEQDSSGNNELPLDRMHLQVLLPTDAMVDAIVTKVIAEASNGSFCLLPRHIDFVAPLVPGVLLFMPRDGPECFAAIDEGVLVKCGQEVLVSTRNGAVGKDLAELEELIDERFLELDDHERRARTALASLEAGALRRFRELQERSHG